MKERQKQILQCIYDNVKEIGYPPTVREIATAVGLESTSTVHGHLSKLEQDGYLFKDPSKPRALEITAKGRELLGVSEHPGIPIIGTVTAGPPITAFEDVKGYFPYPPMFNTADRDDYFMLQIRGTSMINAGILDGDYVIVKKQETAENGAIVIAMTAENEATCKRFYREADHFRLQPENDTMDPIILKQVSILGKVVSLFREHTF